MPHLDATLKKLLQNEKARKLLLLLGAVGVLLLALPTLFPQKETAQPAESAATDCSAYQKELEAQLSRTVSAITGESSPTVLVTLQDLGSAQYAQDEQSAERESERTYVLLKSQSGGQTALLLKEQTPQVQGVVIVSEYAENAAVREKLIGAVQAAFSVPSNRICVVAGAHKPK